MDTIHVTRGWGLLEGFLAKKRTDKANSFIPKSLRQGSILDIGCGSYPYFLLNTDFKEKYGLDPSLKNLRIKNLKLKALDVTKQKLPFKDNYFNAVAMLAVFEHINDTRLPFTLGEIMRVLKPNGMLIITTPAPWADKLLHFMASFGLISSEEIHEHKHHHNKSTIIIKLTNTGFKKEKTKSGYFEMGLNMWFTVKK